MEPAFPVHGLSDAVIEIVSPLTGETGHLSKQSERQSGLQVQPIEAGHVGLEGGRTPEGPHLVSAKSLELLAASVFQPLGQHGDCGDPVFTTQRLCSRSALLSE